MMPLIAEMGYTAIQTSPIQPLKESTTDSTDTVGGCWWVYYQPVGFTITDGSGNALGTRADLISMIEKAHEYDIQVIVDVVANHLGNKYGNDLADKVTLTDPQYWHTLATNISDYSNRYQVTHYCMAGLPDLNTGNAYVQQLALGFLKDCIDAGVDGFRFDAAKHIETPDDDASSASDFWPTVVGGAEQYAQNTYDKDIYVYGEILDSLSGAAISDYTEYMAVTDNSWGNALRENMGSGIAALKPGYDKATAAAQLVLWAESHDTYATDDAGQSSADESVAVINRTWALVAARADAMGLYLARPGSNSQRLGVASVTGWANDEVKAVNLFHNAFAGQSEVVSNAGSIAYVERGNSGVVLVNAKGGSTAVSITAYAMADGEYVDQITGNVFTVKNGKISGTIGSTGIAVVYNAEAEGPSITTQPSDVSLYVGQTVNFAVAAEGEGLTYQWYIQRANETAFTPWNGKTAPSASFMANAGHNGLQVYCVVTDANGNSVTSETVTLTVKANPFSDVVTGHVFYDAIMWAVDTGITSGTTATTFSPEKDCTRGQVVLFLYRYMGKPGHNVTENPFTDVSATGTATFYDAVMWAYENGITTGGADGTFNLYGTVTRGQFVTFLWRMKGCPEPEITENPFGDVEDSSAFYKAILWAYENGITTGKTETTFAPNEGCTRGQVMTMLHRALNAE